MFLPPGIQDGNEIGDSANSLRIFLYTINQLGLFSEARYKIMGYGTPLNRVFEIITKKTYSM
jgi:hypothetical protein